MSEPHISMKEIGKKGSLLTYPPIWSTPSDPLEND